MSNQIEVAAFGINTDGISTSVDRTNQLLQSLEKSVASLAASAEKSATGVDQLDKHTKQLGESVGFAHKSFDKLKDLLKEYVAFEAIKKGIEQVIEATVELEKSENRLAGVFQATGGTVLLTLDELREGAEKLSNQTLFDDKVVRNAEAVLMTFGAVHGDVFQRAIALTADLASLFDGDMVSSTRALGRALEDPVRGMVILQRQGVILSASQKEQIKDLVEQGRLEEAQGKLLDDIAGKVGGLAEKLHSGLTGDLKDAKEGWDHFLESIGKTPLVGGAAHIALQGLALLLEQFATNTAPASGLQQQLKGLQDKLVNGVAFKDALRPLTADEQKAVEDRISLIKDLIAAEEFQNEQAKKAAAAAIEQGKADEIAAKARELAKAVSKSEQEALRGLAASYTDQIAKLTMTTEAYRKYHDALVVATAAEKALAEKSPGGRGAKTVTMGDVDELALHLSALDAAKDQNDRAKKFVTQAEEQFNRGISSTNEAHERWRNQFIAFFKEIDAMGVTIAMAPGIYKEVWLEAAKTIYGTLQSTIEQALTGQLKSVREWGVQLLNIAANIAASFASTFLMNELASTAFGQALHLGSVPAGGHHGGGVIGVDSPAFTRSVPASAFAGAPRFHSGMMADEYPAILQRGESVLTPGQLAAVARGGGTPSVTQHIHFNISAIDGQSVASMLDAQAGTIQGVIVRGLRQSSAFRRALRGAA